MVNKKALKYNLVPKGRTLYFNEEAHAYTDDLEQKYISTTTIIGKYYEKFDTDKMAKICAKIGQNPKHPKYEWYKGKTEKQLKYEWEQETIKACDKGTIKHNYLEDAIKYANGYKRNAKGFINDKIYTIDDIIRGHNYGRLNLDYFREKGVDKKYPKIFAIIKKMTELGYKIYAEIGVYNPEFTVSGLVDVLFVKGLDFVILDWKTNKAPIRFESGYYAKLVDGRLDLSKFVSTEKTFFYPINNIADSVGNHYAMQISVYAYLISLFGFNYRGNILCHIRTIERDPKVLDFENTEDEEVVEIYKLPNLINEASAMIKHYNSKNNIHKSLFV